MSPHRFRSFVLSISSAVVLHLHHFVKYLRLSLLVYPSVSCLQFFLFSHFQLLLFSYTVITQMILHNIIAVKVVENKLSEDHEIEMIGMSSQSIRSLITTHQKRQQKLYEVLSKYSNFSQSFACSLWSFASLTALLCASQL